MGTGFGMVQLICHDQFYHPAMDTAIGRTGLSTAPAKGSFYYSKNANSNTAAPATLSTASDVPGVDLDDLDSDATEACRDDTLPN